MKLCECGCGTAAPIASSTNRAIGRVKGEPMRFCHGHGARRRNVPADGYIVDPATGCWEWQLDITHNGYGRAHVPGSGGERMLAHRLVYERHRGPVPEGLQLDHLCRNRRCVNPDHLEPVTNAENQRRGSATKLNVIEVAAIRSATKSNRELAEIFGVTPENISAIRRRVTWREVA